MSNVFGSHLKISIFGESHGRGVGMTLSGLPGGIRLDTDFIHHQLERRRPGQSKLTTQRKEKDAYEILSGTLDGVTTGAPLTFFIENKDTRSRDYDKTKNLMRPGHADYTGHVKHRGFNDYRGGGHFSARLTAPLVIVGSICQSLLKMKGICIATKIKSIHQIQDTKPEGVKIDQALLLKWQSMHFPVYHKENQGQFEKTIQLASQRGDSVGGQTQTFILGAPAGLGRPFFDALESQIAHLAFSIPGVKGIEFGDGFSMTQHYGSEMNDAFRIQEGKVVTKTNHNGGINGGISNGMPIDFSLAFKPTPSIYKSQATIDLKTMENVDLSIEGRHDPCILLRALPIVDSLAAIVLLDELLFEGRF